MTRYIRSLEKPHLLHEGRAQGERSFDLSGAPALPDRLVQKLKDDDVLLTSEEALGDQVIRDFMEHHKQLRAPKPYTGPPVRNDDEED